ncbi:MAG: GAF domain-containing sensor histidine kinase [Deinococcota bacterium]|nr:GAF domain-containing sensor histidine kinase [Deinococcota bacterium]
MEEEALEKRLQELSVMNAVGELLNEEPDFSRALVPVLRRLVALLGLEAGWVFVARALEGNAHKSSFRLAAATGLPPALARDGAAPLCTGGCECLGLLGRGGLDRGVNMVTCSRLEAATGDRGGLSVHASVPLLGRDGPVGIVNLAAPGDTRLSEATLRFLTAVGRQLGTAFDRSRLAEARSREAQYAAVLEERHRLARDMHDSLAQLLFAAELALRVAREGEAEHREGALASTAELIASAQAELRALVEVLRPAELSGGLLPALERLAKRGAGTARVRLELEDVAVSEAQAEALYRIAQEALHNALRHGGAGEVRLRLERRNGLVLTVEDDGSGFTADASAGLGLMSMRARAEAQGGELSVASRPEGGATVRAWLP